MKTHSLIMKTAQIVVTIIALALAFRGGLWAGDNIEGICYGYTGDSCRDAVINGMGNPPQPCPVSAPCMLDTGIPPGIFICDSCRNFKLPEGTACSCTWTRILNVLSYHGHCSVRVDGLQNC